MRIALASLIVAACALTLGACQGGALGPGPRQEATAPETQEEAIQRAINEVNIDLTAIGRVVNQNEAAGIFAPDIAAGYRLHLRDVAKLVDEAQEILRAGLLAEAANQISLAKPLILTTRKQIEARAVQPHAQPEKPK